MVHLRLYTLLGCAALSLVGASPATRRHTPLVKDSLAQIPHGWTRRGVPSPHHTIRLRIALPQPRFNELERALFEVSDPSHRRYGSHLSKDEVEALVSPNPDSLGLVEDWLASHGFEVSSLDRSPAKDWITILVPVHKAESMLNTKYHIYKNEHTGVELVRTQSFSLPEYLLDHIDVIQPTTAFGSGMRAMASTAQFKPDAPVLEINGAPDTTCNDTYITPSCLQKLYNLEGYIPQATDKNKIGVTGYLNEYANFEDLKKFYQEYLPQAQDVVPDVVLVHNGTNPQNISLAGSEANLDVQYVGALTYPTPNIFWSTGGSPPYKPDTITPTNTNEPYADWLDYVLSQDNLPQTITTSYGDDEQTVPYEYAVRVCNSLAQLGARGISVLFSSGDFGVGGNLTDKVNHGCWSNDGKNTTMFLPAFPASCPYVTAVGGTTNLTEVAVDYASGRYYSGGGFSNYFSRPDYQQSVVNNYVTALGSTNEGLYNKTGRGYPDVAALGTNYRVVISGTDGRIGGTSASSPTFASVISLVNDALLAQGRPPMGFLNPWLYSNGYTALKDITSGSNPGCGTNGFSATQGWDPVTGFGTPDFKKILATVGITI